MARYYIEHDGRVLTVQRDGRHALPGEGEVGVDYRGLARRQVLDEEVVFGQAELDEHPWDWAQKDDLAGREDVSMLVRAAINASLFRPVVGVVVRHEGDVLLVQPARGVAKGHWTLPGGFLGAFEQPTDGARREVREEAGIELDDLQLAGTVTYSHAGAPYPILGLAFTAQATDRALSPHIEEIRDARWFPLAEAGDRSAGFARQVIEQLLKEGTL